MKNAKKQAYEKPTITKLSVGSMNRFARAGTALAGDKIDGAQINDLVQRFGSPLWVVSEASLRGKYRELYRAFSTRYSRVVIAYSYKTNFLSGVCALFHQEGAWAEVVSGFEYDIAMKLGVGGGCIVFNGPFKTREELERAIKQGSMINIDSNQEIYVLEELASAMGKAVKVGVRINMKLCEADWNRFGFNLESGQAIDACRRIASSKHLKLTGLHVHAGTFILDVNIYRTMAEKLVELYLSIKDHPGVRIEYLDVGGGYASKNTLLGHWLPGEYVCPTVDEYAEAICQPLLAELSKVSDMPLLILEPGRVLVDEGMHLITSVVSLKTLADGGKGIVVDAGVNLLPMSYWYSFDIQYAQKSSVTHDTDTTTEALNIYGPLCMQIDCIQIGTHLPPVTAGDILVVKNVGAYNFSMSTQFIRPRPAVVMITKNGTEYLRLRETTEYVTQLERIPERLSKE